MDTVIQILNGLAMLVPILLGTGLIVKYVPFLKGLSNQLIPLLNALITFFVAFGGGATVAHAGFFGDLGHAVSMPARAAASILVAGVASWVYEKYLRGPLDALGLKKP